MPTSPNHFVARFPVSRAAGISAGVALFVLAVRPFGASASNVAELLAILGLAPLNFAALALVHVLPYRGDVLGTAARVCFIAAANTVYISVFSSGHWAAIALNVAIMSGLIVAAVALWNRERAARREVIELRQSIADRRDETNSLIVLRSENGREVLRTPSHALLFVQAKGNYVLATHVQNGAIKETLLRTSLHAIKSAAPDHTLIYSHRSYLVNIGAARRIVNQNSRMRIEFDHGVSAPVSRSHQTNVRDAARD